MTTVEPDTVSIDSGFAEIDFLMPNGFMVRLPCDRRSSFGEVKSILWEEALRLPAANHLRNSDQYVFVGVSKEAIEKVFHDSMLVDEVEQLIANVVEVSEPKLERDRIRLEQEIGKAIGVSVQQLDNISANDEEHKDARIHFKRTAEAVAKERESWSKDKQTKFFFPANIDINHDLPIATAKKIHNSKNMDCLIPIKVWVARDDQQQAIEIKVPANHFPSELVNAAVAAIKSKADAKLTSSLRGTRRPSDRHIEYVLKRCDCEEFFLVERDIHTYAYIRHCINRGQEPQLQLVDKDNLLKKIPDNNCISMQEGMPTLKHPSQGCLDYSSSWNVSNDCKYSIKLRQMPVDRSTNGLYFVEAQIFHGSQALCPPINSDNEGFNTKWLFGISIDSLPRTSRLCFMLCLRKESYDKRGHKWVNMQIFDRNGKMKTGLQKIDAWEISETTRKSRNPFGTPGAFHKDVNPLEFEVLCPASVTSGNIVYPSDSQLVELIAREQQYDTEQTGEMSFMYMDRIHEKEVLKCMTEKEKNELWKTRHIALEYQPALLPRIIQCVDWSNRHQVFKLYQLLQNHIVQSFTVALQLLAPEYPDAWVRRLAVQYMEKHLPPEQLDLYMLQLVQCLLFESYQHNDLAQLLLRRALAHRTIGHHFFWLLRSEMHIPLSQLRFAPILESYCQYCGCTILLERLKEVQTVDDLHLVTREIRKVGEENTKEPERLEEQTRRMKTLLERHVRHGDLQKQGSIMNKDVELGELQLSKCKVMRSKMRPVWMSWENKSRHSSGTDIDKVEYIVKDGDDLRQDMLVLQLLKVMDMVWKYSCHDYWMTIYSCMATGENVGIIEAVRDTLTICDIELDTTSQIIKTKSINQWMYETTGGGDRYMEAVKRFTYSCAGYTVAAYVLGIGDRHSDNIMLKQEGELFHIDFGHFMDHKKSKGGIKRERVPFVITKEFVAVICRGDMKGTKEFDEFLFLCYEAFMTIRKNGTLFLTLLNLMMHCNLPELNCDIDLKYCRDCLGLDKPEHEVAKDFYAKFLMAYRKQWMTNLNWFFHRFHRVMQSNKSSSGSS